MNRSKHHALMGSLGIACVALLGFFVAVLDAGEVHAVAPAWETNFEAAMAQAKSENKVLLLYFTGSDWCGPCKSLRKNVFNTAEFVELANDQLVLQMIDFPKFSKQPEPLAQQNYALGNAYGVIVEGMLRVPSVLLLGPNGELLGRTTYRQQNATDYIAHLEELAGGSLSLTKVK